MVIKTLKRFMRAPVPAIALILFSAVISIIICSLHLSNEAEVKHFEEVSATVPIKVTVMPLGDSKRADLAQWVIDVFTGENYQPDSLHTYVKDVQIKESQWIKSCGGTNFGRSGGYYLRGITSLSCEKQLLPEYGCVITWNEGYDERLFDGKEPLCIIPEDMSEKYDNGNGWAVLDFENKVTRDGKEVIYGEYQCKLKIVGTYTAGDGKSVYCSIPIIEQVFGELNQARIVNSLSATIDDNSRLEEFREKKTNWFAEFSPNGENIPWGRNVSFKTSNGFSSSHYYKVYPYALDIDDRNYQNLLAILEDSLEVNRICTLIVFALSAVAGLLVGFLMIRRRKRDIMLMRMVGESNSRVYFGFVLEQMICILLGITVGGAYNIWKPIDKLALFALVYFVGLTLSLVVFMNTKLIKNIKEDE